MAPPGAGQVERVARTLPKFPREVIQEWLLPHISELGWPPSQDALGLPIGRWRLLLMNRPVAFWAALEWRLEERDLPFYTLTNQARETINSLIDGYVNGRPNFYTAYIPDGKDRFYSILVFMSERGQLPVAPVLLRESEGLAIADGNHRLAAYFFYPAFWEHEATRKQLGDGARPPAQAVGQLPVRGR